MRPSETRNNREEYRTFSKTIQIGIFGYFGDFGLVNLKKLRDYLVDQGFNAKLSIDIETPDSSVISPPADAIKSSQILYRSSQILIYIITPTPQDQQKKLLDSVSMEYGWAYLERRNCVGVYFQSGNEFNTLPQGAIDELREENWRMETFNQIEDVFGIISRFCEDKIRELYSVSDII